MLKKEEKIFLNKDEGVSEVEDKIKNTKEEKIILNIPKGSVLVSSIHYFQKIKKIVEESNKEILIESVDEKVLELATLTGLNSHNPVFKKKERIIADILPKKFENLKSREKIKEEKDLFFGKEEEKNKVSNKEKIKYENLEDFWGEDKKKKKEKKAKTELIEEYIPEINLPQKPKRKRKKILITSGVLILLIGVFFVFTYLLPHLNIVLNIKKTPINFSNQVIVSTKTYLATSSNGLASSTIYLPGQIVATHGNLTLHFTGSGLEENVSTKASGTLVVYNYYSPTPLTFVANTRFLSPSGKVFRAVNKVVIPGFKKDSEGKIIPGQTEIAVVADQPGQDYNVTPATNWTIPGLKGLPQYDKIYAENKNSFQGGFIGKQFVPSETDLENAKNEIASKLKNSLSGQLDILNKQNLKILDQAVSFNITQENITKGKNNDGFDIFAAADMKEMAFNEEDLKKVILNNNVANKEINWQVNNFEINYTITSIDFNQGIMNLNVNGSLIYSPQINLDDLKKSIAGKDINLVKEQVFSLPGLESANISAWPFWVLKAPTNLSRINILVE